MIGAAHAVSSTRDLKAPLLSKGSDINFCSNLFELLHKEGKMRSGVPGDPGEVEALAA